jgi:xylulokinase
MKRYILAHDLGTTGNKATLYDDQCSLVNSAFYGYATRYANIGWAEQNPQDWWEAVCATTKKLLHASAVGRDEIACIVFSGQMMGCVPIDQRGHPIRDAIIWADQRSVEQARWMAQQIDPEQVYRITGHRLSPSYSAAKILWVRDHQPDIYQKTCKFVHAKDSIIARLTGNFVTDRSDAGGMNLYHLEQAGWSEDILQALRLDREKLPEIHLSIDVVGEVTRQVAEEVGVAVGTPVVIGGGDGSCAATGAGVIREGAAYNYIGSSSWIGVAARNPIYDPEMRTFNWAHLVPGLFTPTGTMQMAGGSYQWTRDQLCPLEVDSASQMGTSPYAWMDTAAESSPAGARGLIFLPYLLGERSPRWNPNARGAFVGLTVTHTRADMIRAVLEGIALNLRVILEAFQSQGARIEAMRLIGGGARSRLWNQIMANVYGVKTLRLAMVEEATALGAAIAGGVGVGLFPDFTIAERLTPIAATFEVQPEARAAYDRTFEIFEATYTALEPIYDRLARL